MSILTWLKEVTTGDSKAGLIDTDSMQFAAGEQQFLGLDMKAALDAHMDWTRRLEGIINGSNKEQLDVATVASDCQCKLGKWIHTAAKAQFGDEPDLNELQHVHADFHLKAGEVLKNMITGNEADALNNLKKLRHQSGNVQLSLVRLYSHEHH